ncbi:MAG: glycerol acyltransferase [Bacteroidales bacterium]|nr:glycerol acyltransferase [Bacteroidales bacterium]
MKENGQTIEIGKVLEKKTGRRLPAFFVHMLEKFIHQDYINGYLSKPGEGKRFFLDILDYMDLKISVRGWENLDKAPKGALFTFAANHPLGGVDAIALQGLIWDHFDSAPGILANDFLMNIPAVAELGVGINKTGGQARNLGEEVRALYHSDRQILMFPSGKCSRMIDGKIQDPEWKKTFVKMSVESGRWIVPVRFIGENSRRFYCLDRIFNKLGIKFNIGMALLPDELYKARGKSFGIIIGEPIPPTCFTSEKTAQEWAADVRKKVYNLK